MPLRRAVLAALLAATACASVRAGSPAAPPRTVQPLPLPEMVGDDEERARLSEAVARARLGDAARDAGIADQARSEWKMAGAQLLALSRGRSSWRLVYRAAGARFLLLGGELDAAARAAEQTAADPQADAPTRAVAARTRAAALDQLAAAEVKAGRLEPLPRPGHAARPEGRIEPRVPAPPWLRLLEADDAYVAASAADPDPAAPAVAGAAAYQAALILYGHDNLDDAARRLRALVDQAPAGPALGDAVGLWLEVFAVRGDLAGHAAALERATAVVESERRKLAAGPGPAEERTPAERERSEQLWGIEAQLTREKQSLGFQAALRLSAQGKHAEAAATFEAFASAHPLHPDAAAALFDAGEAWSAARQRERAAAARGRLQERHPASRLAQKAILAEAADLAAGGDRTAAAARYATYLERHPDGEDRCAALQALPVELDLAQRHDEAATRYVAQGSDPRCSRADPNGAAKALYRAAALLGRARKARDSQAALRILAALPGVSDPTARGYVDDARARTR